MPRLVTCLSHARVVWLALVVVGCEDFPPSPASSVTVEEPAGAPWPQQLFNKDTSILTIVVQDQSGTVITGLQVAWRSSDASVLEVRPVDSIGPTHEDSLVAELSVRIVAQRRGTATISATITQPGIKPTGLSQEVRVMERWIQVSAGYNHSCAVTIDHDAYCWGIGFLGNGSAAGSAKPVLVGGGFKFGSVTAGDGHSCGVLLDGTVQCWGTNALGALGTGAAGDQALPATVSLVSTFATVVAGDNYVCGVSGVMTGYCWGNNDSWQLGDALLIPHVAGTGAPSPPFDVCVSISRTRCSRIPRQVRDRGSDAVPDGTPLPISEIAPGVSHTCALRANETAVCWGSGSAELGSTVQVTTDSTSANPFRAISGMQFSHIASGNRYTCAIGAADGLAYCWGYNSYGQLGRTAPGSFCAFGNPPTVGCSPIPQSISGSHRFSVLASGGNSTCGIASEAGADSAGFCWGSNEFGQLGDPSLRGACDLTTACSPTPAKVNVPGHLVSLSVGPSHACAVTSIGAAFCWGDSTGGQLGNEAASDTGLLGPTRVDEPIAARGSQ